MKTNISLLIAVLALTLVSCLKNDIVIDTDDMDFRTVEFAAPIAKIHVPLYESMKKWMEFDSLTFNQKQVVCIVYTHSEEIDWNKDISIDDYSIEEATVWKYDLSQLIPDGLTFKNNHTFPIKLTTSDKEAGSYVSEAKLTGGKIELSFNNIPEGVYWEIQVTIPELSKNGDIFQETFTEFFSDKPAVDLTDYEIHTNVDRLLNMECVFTFHGAVSNIVDINLGISDLSVQYMSGYFGQPKQILENKRMNFNFFHELDFDGTIGFKDIELKAEIVNPVGVPISVKANRISFTNEEGLYLEPEMTEPIDIYVPAATEDNDHRVTSAEKSFITYLHPIEFRDGNYPSLMEFDFVGIANPNGEDPEVKNFIVIDIDDFAKVDLALTVPLHVKAEAYQRADTVDFDYNDLTDNDEKFSKSISRIVLNMIVDNNLPFDIRLTADAIDADEKVVVSDLMTSNIISKRENQTITIELTQQDHIEKMRTGNVKNIVLYSRAQTENEEYVEVKKDDYLDITVSLRFKSDIPSNIFE